MIMLNLAEVLLGLVTTFSFPA